MVETIGEAFSLGWRVTARCSRGREDGPSSKSSRECATGANLIWRRWSARAGEIFRCRGSKAACGVHGAAIDGSSWCLSRQRAPQARAKRCTVMQDEIADAVLGRVKDFTIGFAIAGDVPSAKGSGVLIKHGGRHGILTCAHVDKYLRDLKRDVGLVRPNRGHAQQAGTLAMDEVFPYVAGEPPWDAGSHDIAFIHLPPHLVGNIARDCVFLDAEKNFSKPQPDNHSSLIQVHSVFGLVEQFTGATTRKEGRATTLLKGVL